MARRRKRTPLNPAPLLWAALAVNVALGLALSPMTSLTRVRVIGCPEGDRERLADILSKRAGSPFALVNRLQIESEIQSLPDIDVARVDRNLFGRGLVRVKPRKSVAVLEGVAVSLDDDANLFRTSGGGGGSRLALPGTTFAANMTLARPVDLLGVVEVVKDVNSDWPSFDGTIALSPNGSVCLNRGKAGKVDLGGTEALEEKFRRLRKLLEDHSEFFSSPYEVNLTAPNRPASRPLDETGSAPSKQHEPVRNSNSSKGLVGHSSKPSVRGAGVHDGGGLGDR